MIGDTRNHELEARLPTGGDIVLGTELVGRATRRVRTSGVLGALTRTFDRRARLVVLGLVVLIVLSTVNFHAGGRDWRASLYLALTASAATGDGDLDELSLGFRFGAVVIQLFGLVLASGITALLVDLLITARLAAITGGVRGRPRHHVVVCGLGRVGTAAAARLKARQVLVDDHAAEVGLRVLEVAQGVPAPHRLDRHVLQHLLRRVRAAAQHGGEPQQPGQLRAEPLLEGHGLRLSRRKSNAGPARFAESARGQVQ